MNNATGVFALNVLGKPDCRPPISAAPGTRQAPREMPEILRDADPALLLRELGQYEPSVWDWTAGGEGEESASKTGQES